MLRSEFGVFVYLMLGGWNLNGNKYGVGGSCNLRLEYIRNYQGHAEACRKKRAKTDCGPKWVSDHPMHFATWAVGSSKAELLPGQVRVGAGGSFEKCPCLKRLSMRELDILMQLCPVVPTAAPLLLDLSQGAKRCRVQGGAHARTITPAGVLFHTQRVREIRGMEKLRIQGIMVSDDILQIIDDNTLSDLAGNAFSFPCCGAAILVGLAVLGSSV